MRSAVQLDPQDDTTGVGVNGTAGTVGADNIYVGVKGGFGDIRLGEIPLAVEYGQVANDIYDVGATVVDGASYVGAFGPVGLIANYSLENDSDMAGIGVKFTLAGVTIGAGYESRVLSGNTGNGNTTGNFAVGASFALAGFSIGAHYWLQEGPDGDIDFDADENAGGELTGDLQSTAIQIGYGIAGVNLAVTYALLTTDITNINGDGTNDNSTLRLDAGYDLGGGMDISTRISAVNDDPADDNSSDLPRVPRPADQDLLIRPRRPPPGNGRRRKARPPQAPSSRKGPFLLSPFSVLGKLSGPDCAPAAMADEGAGRGSVRFALRAAPARR